MGGLAIVAGTATYYGTPAWLAPLPLLQAFSEVWMVTTWYYCGPDAVVQFIYQVCYESGAVCV
jgi:hypothetical protein